MSLFSCIVPSFSTINMIKRVITLFIVTFFLFQMNEGFSLISCMYLPIVYHIVFIIYILLSASHGLSQSQARPG